MGRRRRRVRALARDRVVDVGERRQAGELADPVARDAARVAAAVPALVMVAHDAAHERADGGAVEQGDPGLRVRLHERPLVRLELARLVEHLARDDHLADVVQQQAHAELGQALVDPVPAAAALEVDPALGAPVGAAEQQAQRGHVDRVAVGVLVRAGQVAEEQGGVGGVGDAGRDQVDHVAQLGQHVVGQALAVADRRAGLVERRGHLGGRLDAHRLGEQLDRLDALAQRIVDPDRVDAVIAQRGLEPRRDDRALAEQRDPVRPGRGRSRASVCPTARVRGVSRIFPPYRRKRRAPEPWTRSQPSSQPVRCPSSLHMTGKKASSSSRSPGRR